jgi:ADP-ribose pyrophosphatase
MIKKWETVENKFVENLKIFDLNIVKRFNNEISKEGSFIVLNSPKWVNIIPVTRNNEVVLVEQYRHGIDEITLEVPGGLVENGEDPRDAGERECREETGYEGVGQAILLGENQPNPAFLNNLCYSYLWTGCEKKFNQALDGNEDINVVLLPFSEINDYILSGKIKHSLVLTAFLFYFLKFGKI